MMDISKIDLMYREISRVETKKGWYIFKETYAKKMLKNHLSLRFSILRKLFYCEEIRKLSYDFCCDYDIRDETTVYEFTENYKRCFINYKAKR